MNTCVDRIKRRAANSIKRLASRGIILMYHRVTEVQRDPWRLCVTPHHFAEHLEVLKKNYQPTQLKKLVDGLKKSKIPRSCVIVTFDDGYADNLYNAKPLLERYEIPATVFITTGYLGTSLTFWWDELENVLLQTVKLPESLSLSINGCPYRWRLVDDEIRNDHYPNVTEEPRSSREALLVSIWRILRGLRHRNQLRVMSQLREWANIEPSTRPTHRTLSLEEARELGKGNLIEIGAHTDTHPVLSELSLTEQRNEIRRSKTHVEEVIGKAVTSFAYPFGGKDDYTRETVAVVRETGFACACSTMASIVERSTDPFQLPRVHIEDCNGDDFAKKLSMWFDA